MTLAQALKTYRRGTSCDGGTITGTALVMEGPAWTRRHRTGTMILIGHILMPDKSVRRNVRLWS